MFTWPPGRDANVTDGAALITTAVVELQVFVADTPYASVSLMVTL